MKLLENLRAEHDLIEQVVGSLQTFVDHLTADRRVAGTVAPRTDAGRDGAAFVRFFRRYADRHHHGREEDVLFAALVRELGVPADRGPIAALTADHRELASHLDAIAAALGGPDTATRIGEPAGRFIEGLLHHIDAENSVLLPECETRLRRAGVTLDDRPPDTEAEAARAEGERLIGAWAPREPAHFLRGLRGEGCVCCPSYGVRCDGVEREWWSDEEWEDFFERND